MKAKRFLAAILVFALLASFCPALAAGVASAYEDEEAFRAAIAGEPEWASAYPNGLFNFLGSKFEVNESDDFYEIAVVRQGGTEGAVSVNFKALDITARYGEDYSIRVYTDDPENRIEQNPDAQPILDFSGLDGAVDLSGGIDIAEENEDVTDAVELPETPEESEEPEEPEASEEPEALEEPEEASITALEETKPGEAAYIELPQATVYSDEELTISSENKSLRGIRETALGQTSDRPNWELADEGRTEEIKAVYDRFFGQAEGTETTLDFADGEYIKYLYIVPTKDDVYKGDRQALFILSEPTNGAVRGESYMTDLSLIDDAEAPRSDFRLIEREITLAPEDTEVVLTVMRTSGIEAAAVITVGTAEDTAVAGADYEEGTQTVLFPAGVTQKQVTVSILPNPARTSARRFAVMLDGLPANINPDAYYTVVTIPGIEAVEEQSALFDEITPTATVPSMSNRAATISWGGKAAGVNQGTTIGHSSPGAPSKGRWYVNTEIFPTSSSVSRDGVFVWLNHTGGSTSSYTTELKYYGVSSIQYLSSNHGKGRSWEQDDDDWWCHFWGCHHWNWHHENAFDGSFDILGSDGKWTEWKKGRGNTTRFESHTKTLTSTTQWDNKKTGIYSSADSGNNSQYIVDDIVLNLKAYTVKVATIDKVPLYHYNLQADGTLKQIEKWLEEVPVTMKIFGVDSKVNNAQSFPSTADTKSVTAYRSDFVGVSMELNSKYVDYGYVDGFEYQVGNGAWTKVTSDGLLLDDAFFQANLANLWANSTIQIRPRWHHNTVTNVTVAYTYSSDKGTGIVGVGNSAKTNDLRSRVLTDNRLRFGDTIRMTAERGYANLTPLWNLAGSIRSVPGTDEMTSQFELRAAKPSMSFTLGNPTLTVRGAPEIYGHRVDSAGTYKIDANQYGNTGAARGKFASDMDGVFDRGENPQITIAFSYKWDDVMGRDDDGVLVDGALNASSKAHLGSIPDAVLTVYDSVGNIRNTYTLKPSGGSYPTNLNASYSLTGRLSDLKWQKGDYATVYFVGTALVYDIALQKNVPARTMEMSIDFVSNTADAVVVVAPDSTLGAALIGEPYTISPAEFNKSYDILSLTQPGFVTRWLDGSNDKNNDGVNDIATKDQVFFGNVFPFTVKYEGRNKLYYDYTKSVAGAAESSIDITIREETYKAIDNKTKIYRPVAGATITLLGREIGQTDAMGRISFRAMGLNKGSNYMLNVLYKGNSYNIYAVAGNGPETKTLALGDAMHAELFPTGIMQKKTEAPDFAGLSAATTKETVTFTSLAAVLDSNEKFSYGLTFKFVGTAVVQPNTAILRIYKTGGGVPEEVYASTPIYIDPQSKTFIMSDSQYFAPSAIVTRKDIDNYEVVISAQFREGIGSDDETVTYTYPDFPTGITFKSPAALIDAVASFTAEDGKMDIIGAIKNKYSFGVKISTDQMKYPRYVLDEDNQYSQKPKISFGLSFSDVREVSPDMHDIPQKQEYVTTSPPGNAEPRIIDPSVYSGAPDDGEPLVLRMKPVTVADTADALFDQPGSVASRGAKIIGTLNGVADRGSAIPVGSGLAYTGFGWRFDVSVEVTYDIPYVDDGWGGVKQSGRLFFDSMTLTVTAMAEFAEKVEYVTPIGIPIFAAIRLIGQLTAVVGIEAYDKDPYRQAYQRGISGSVLEDEDGNKKFYYVYEIDENGLPLVLSEYFDETHTTSIDFFDEYARLLLYPSIKVSLGAGFSMLNIYLTGTALFDMEFNSLGYNGENSSGQGGVTLDASFGIKILFIQKEWSIARKRFEFFNYGDPQAAMMETLSDPYRNYLYEDADDFTVTSRAYLDYRGSSVASNRMALLADGSAAGDIVPGGMYPNPRTKLLELPDGKLFLLFVDDVNAYGGITPRNEYNRAGVFYTVFNGSVWSAPKLVDEDDGTWDDYPDCAIVDGKILATFSNSDRVYGGDAGPEEVLSATNISGRWFDLSGAPKGISFDITWTSDATGAKTDDFDLEHVYDMFGDSESKISYDPLTGRLLIYYVKTDYINPNPFYHEDLGDSETTKIGDIVNAYSVIAYRTAQNDGNGMFVWNTGYEPGDRYEAGFYGQRFLDLAVPAEITEEVIESDDGAKTVSQTVNSITQVNDPRIIASDLTTYNGLALYAYALDFDADLKTTTDQELYLQIYNYEENSFSYPIQLTNNYLADGDPQFVRVNNITYLYFLSGGDVKYMNISDLVKFGLKLEPLPNGKTIYIVDKSGFGTADDHICTAVKHEEDPESETAQPISEFTVRAENADQGAGVYLLWSAITDAPEDGAEESAESAAKTHATSKIIYAAYSRPAEKRDYELTSGAFTVQDSFAGKFEYVFVDGANPLTTYPEGIRILEDFIYTDHNGNTIAHTAGTVSLIDYDVIEDKNGYKGVVSAGDPVMIEITSYIEDSYEWSRPVAITPVDGTCYSDLSFVVNGNNDLTITYLKYREKDYALEVDENGEVKDSNITSDMMDLSTTSLSYGRYILSSDLQVGEVVTDAAAPTAGQILTFTAELGNAGLRPIDDIWVKPYAKQDGAPLELMNGDEAYQLTAADMARSYFVGGETRMVEAAVILPESISGIEVGFDVWTGTPEEPTVPAMYNTKTVLAAGDRVFADAVMAELVSADEGKLTFSFVNLGNLPFEGIIQAVHSDTGAELLREEVSARAQDESEYEFAIALESNLFTVKSAEGSDGSVYDAAPMLIKLLDKDGVLLSGEEGYQAAIEVSFKKIATAHEAAMMKNIKTFSITGEKTVAAGGTRQLTGAMALFAPLGEAENDEVEVLWSSDSKTITVNGAGVVSVDDNAKPGDTATITAYAKPQSSNVYGNFDGSFETVDNFNLLPEAMIRTASTTITVTAPPSPQGPGTGGGARPTSIPPTVFDRFTDIAATDWFAADVAYVVEEDLFAGVSENEFAPERAMTRAMLVTVLHRFAGLPEGSGTNHFDDVPDGQWYTEAVAWAAENEIVYGIGDNLFAPDAEITREQTATILYRFAKYANTAPQGEWAVYMGFEDVADISDWAAEAAMYCFMKGIITGKPGNLFDPQGLATRAEMAAMMHRFAEAE